MENWRTKWMTKKSDISLSLANGICGAGYAEAVIILCSALSAVAAEIWPGRNKDRSRFTELLIHSSEDSCSLISVPILFELLKADNHSKEVKILDSRIEKFGLTRVLTSSDVDIPEKEVAMILPNLNLKKLRSCSYAALLYDEVRSYYVHQYDPGDRSNAWPMSTYQNSPASYVNLLSRPRQIHFHVEWLSKVAVKAAKYADNLGRLPQEDPASWWVHASHIADKEVPCSK